MDVPDRVNASTMAPHASILDLPPELLLIIKTLIEPWDLRTHVCFYKSHPGIAALYDSEQDPDAFWELACWNNGLGFGVESMDQAGPTMWDDTGEISWKRIAMDCISRDGFCTHPRCGEALLQYNRQRMRNAANEVKPLEPIRVRDYSDDLSLTAHELFGHVEFHRDYDFFHRRPAHHDAHLRSVASPVPRASDPDYLKRPDRYSGLYLAEHPLVARSFATSVPVSCVMLLGVAGKRLSRGVMDFDRAITVLDVLSVVHEQLDESLDVDEAYEYVDLHEGCIPDTWKPKMILRNVRTLRSILSVCPIIGLEHEENTEYGPAFSFKQL